MRVCPNCSFHHAQPGWHCPNCQWAPTVSAGGVPLFAPAFEKANTGFQAGFFADLETREDGHFWFEARNALILWAMRKYAPHAANYLEIGCGTGFVLAGVRREFPGLEVHGSEIFSAGLTVAQKRVPDADFLQLDARKLPYESEFDLIGAFDVIEHIDEDEAVLANIARALRNDGTCIITVPQHPFLWSAADVYAHHKRRYVRGELKAKLAAAGLQCLKMTSFISLLLPVMLVSRVMQQNSRPEDFNPSSEFDISPAVNHMLRKMLKAEAMLIRAGLSLPAGGSLLAVVRKIGGDTK